MIGSKFLSTKRQKGKTSFIVKSAVKAKERGENPLIVVPYEKNIEEVMHLLFRLTDNPYYIKVVGVRDLLEKPYYYRDYQIYMDEATSCLENLMKALGVKLEVSVMTVEDTESLFLPPLYKMF